MLFAIVLAGFAAFEFAQALRKADFHVPRIPHRRRRRDRRAGRLLRRARAASWLAVFVGDRAGDASGGWSSRCSPARRPHRRECSARPHRRRSCRSTSPSWRAFAVVLLRPGRRRVVGARVHHHRRRGGHRRVRGRALVRQAPDGARISPKKTWEGFAGRRWREPHRRRAARDVHARPTPGGSDSSSARRSSLTATARRPRRIADQARHRHQGHELVAAGPRRIPRPARLDPAVGGGRVRWRSGSSVERPR